VVALARGAGRQGRDAQVVVGEHGPAALEHLAREADARLEPDPDHLGRRAGGGGHVQSFFGRAAIDDGEVGVEDRQRLAADARQQRFEVERLVQRLGSARQSGLALDLARVLVGGLAVAERGAGRRAECGRDLDLQIGERAAAEQQRLVGQGHDQEGRDGRLEQ
jgi:hypothetical protein